MSRVSAVGQLSAAAAKTLSRGRGRFRTLAEYARGARDTLSATGVNWLHLIAVVTPIALAGLGIYVQTQRDLATYNVRISALETQRADTDNELRVLSSKMDEASGKMDVLVQLLKK